MGANIFVFRLEEEALKAALEQIEHQKSLYPGHTWGMEISVDLVPDGMGYEIRDLQQKIVSNEETTCLSPVVVGERQQNFN